jgi:hypothetical protein
MRPLSFPTRQILAAATTAQPIALEIDGASGKQGKSLSPLGARWTFSKGIGSQKSGVLPHANFAFSP